MHAVGISCEGLANLRSEHSSAPSRLIPLPQAHAAPTNEPRLFAHRRNFAPRNSRLDETRCRASLSRGNSEVGATQAEEQLDPGVHIGEERPDDQRNQRCRLNYFQPLRTGQMAEDPRVHDSIPLLGGQAAGSSASSAGTPVSFGVHDSKLKWTI